MKAGLYTFFALLTVNITAQTPIFLDLNASARTGHIQSINATFIGKILWDAFPERTNIMATGGRKDPYRGFNFRLEIDGVIGLLFMKLLGLT